MLNELSAWINGLAPLLMAGLAAIWLLKIFRWRLGVKPPPPAAPFYARLWSWSSFQILKPFGEGRRNWALCFHLGLMILVAKHLIFLISCPWPWWVWRAVSSLSPLLYAWLIMLMIMMARRVWSQPPRTPNWPLSNWLVVILLALAAGSGFFLAHSQSLSPGFLVWAETPWERRAFFLKQPAGWLSLHLVLVSGLLTAWITAPLNRHPWHK